MVWKSLIFKLVTESIKNSKGKESYEIIQTKITGRFQKGSDYLSISTKRGRHLGASARLHSQ